MAPTYRSITATSYEEARSKLQAGEQLVVTNTGAKHPKDGHIPVTTWQTFEDHKSHNFYARKD